ncbi:nucleotidyltransferase and HEPN domain-containing protein [soil metagenome]
MKADLDHLPEQQQAELARVRSILLSEFDSARNGGGGGTQPWRRGGHIQKIILFGSYARNDWVDEPDNGYLSDFDLLVIVSHEQLTDIANYWWVAENKILHDPLIGRTVNIIVHDLAPVNAALGRGEYFWTDIVQDGVALYEVPGHPFAPPKSVTDQDAWELGRRYFDEKFQDIELWIENSVSMLAGPDSQRRRKNAAFNLHQAVETAYACVLLVNTFYFPRSHNIKFLRSLAEDIDKRLAQAWPRDSRTARRRFELLKRAYVEARYSDQFDPSIEDLEALRTSAAWLRDLVETNCRDRLETLRIAAADSSSQGG